MTPDQRQGSEGARLAIHISLSKHPNPRPHASFGLSRFCHEFVYFLQNEVSTASSTGVCSFRGRWRPRSLAAPEERLRSDDAAAFESKQPMHSRS
jgi:hypothetical protein